MSVCLDWQMQVRPASFKEPCTLFVLNDPVAGDDSIRDDMLKANIAESVLLEYLALFGKSFPSLLEATPSGKGTSV